MSSPAVASESKRKLWALDPDLPMLATEAAIDLENIRLNKEPSLDAIKQLAELISMSFRTSAESGSPHSLMDSGTLTVLGDAITESFRPDSLNTVEELLKEAETITSILSKVNQGQNVPKIEQARDFCLALSKAAMAYHTVIWEQRPSHPFRRQ